MIHSRFSATNASRACLSRRPSAARKFFTVWMFFSMLIEISPFPLPNHAVEELLLLLEQVLEDEWSPDAAPCVHQQAALVKLSESDGRESKSLRQVRDRSDRVLIIARQKDDAMASLNNRIAGQRSRTQVVKTFHDLSTGEGLRNEGGGRETVQFLRWQRKRVHCVDDRLALPTRQRLRNLTMFSERDCQDDRVGFERIPQRLGDDRGSNRPSLRRQRLGRPAARDRHVDVVTGKGVGEGLADL